MDKQEPRILVLVEGEKREHQLMKRLFKIYGILDHHQIVSYNTNIYTLYNLMFLEGEPDSYDLLQSLKNREKDDNKKKIFDYNYSDILLIFDYEPQAPDFSVKKIKEMVGYFTESSDMGKLYLNYPMVEAFFHMNSIPDQEYNTYMVSLNELERGNYKRIVSEICRDKDYRKFAAVKEESDCVIKQNICKSQYLTKMGVSDTSQIPTQEDILEKELYLLESKKAVSVLCTSIFYIVEYNSKLVESSSF